MGTVSKKSMLANRDKDVLAYRFGNKRAMELMIFTPGQVNRIYKYTLMLKNNQKLAIAQFDKMIEDLDNTVPDLTLTELFTLADLYGIIYTYT